MWDGHARRDKRLHVGWRIPKIGRPACGSHGGQGDLVSRMSRFLVRFYPSLVAVVLGAVTLGLLMVPGEVGPEIHGVRGWLSVYAAHITVVLLVAALIWANAARERLAAVSDRGRRWVRRQIIPLAVVGLLFVWLFIYLIPNIFIFVKPGEGGVLWHRFGNGTVTDRSYGEGTHIILPWDLMYIYNVRLQNRTQVFEVLSKDGLLYHVALTIRFRLILEDLGLLHQHVGPDYVNTLIFPELGSHARALMAQYRADEVYTTRRLEIENEILARLRREMVVGYIPEVKRESYLHVENVLVRQIILPKKVADAIENKLAQEQMMLEYDFRLGKEMKEAERKRIEAYGIRDFQSIVRQGISEQLLKWKGINATLELARSNNSKIVVIGAGKEGMPLILGGFDSSASAARSTPANPQGSVGSSEDGQSTESQGLDWLQPEASETGLSAAPDGSRAEPALPAMDYKPAPSAVAPAGRAPDGNTAGGRAAPVTQPPMP